jgi:hypothetical protein
METKRRTDVVGVFLTWPPCCGSPVLCPAEVHDEWQVNDRRHL